MKRLLLCSILLCTCLTPSRAQATWGWVVFTVFADPLDPLGGTSTGWLEIAKQESNGRPRFISGDVDFWWQARHWTEEDTVASDWIELVGAEDKLKSWALYGGTEQDYLWGNYLSYDFDFSLSYKDIVYVNPTAFQFAANGESYFGSVSWYFTEEQPPAASPPGVPEPSSLALVVLGLGAVAASRRSTR